MKTVKNIFKLSVLIITFLGVTSLGAAANSKKYSLNNPNISETLLMHGIAVSPDGRFAATFISGKICHSQRDSWEKYKTLELWSIQTNQCVSHLNFEDFNSWNVQLTFSRNSEFFTVYNDSKIRLYKFLDNNPELVLNLENFNELEKVFVSPDGRFLVVCDKELVWLLRVEDHSKKYLCDRRFFEPSAHSIDFSRDGNFLVAPCDYGAFNLWNLVDGECVCCVKCEDLWANHVRIESLIFSNQDTQVFSFYDSSFKMDQWGFYPEKKTLDKGIFVPVCTFNYCQSIGAVAISPDDKYLFANLHFKNNSVLGVWDLCTKEFICELRTEMSFCVKSIVLSSDGTQLIVLYEDGIIKIYTDLLAQKALQDERTDVISWKTVFER